MPKLVREMTHTDMVKGLRRAEAELVGLQEEYARLLRKQSRLLARVSKMAAELGSAADNYLATKRFAHECGAIGPAGVEVEDAAKAAAGS